MASKNRNEDAANEDLSEQSLQRHTSAHTPSEAQATEDTELSTTDACLFRGSFQHALDDKGRVSIPALFRKALEEQGVSTLVLTNFITDGARCLDGFTLPAWRAFEAKLSARSRFDPQVRKLENFYLARAALCPLDGSGRVNIPPYLRAYAGMERDVVFTASLHGFRVWDKRVWELVFREAETALLEDPSLFTDVDV
ncbi:MAG: division/cell wall cluster transcriptional repressor MraZ [Bdellovibrionales bacterium]|nr:division/cell wall cluster transcriptional repressor MraZ [Bdellovibrionales bacterium]